MTDYSKASLADTEVPEYGKIVLIRARGHRPEVEFEYPEFQSLCPVSGRHDQGTVIIRYRPEENLLEGKSLRDYLASWRTTRNWQEYITEEIADKLFSACSPSWLTVDIHWAPRGGIYTTTTSARGEIP